MPGEDGYEELLARCDFEDPSVAEGRRSIVRVDVTRIADSCGYGVPLLRYEGEREHAQLWAEKRLRSRGPHARSVLSSSPAERWESADRTTPR